MTEKYIPNGKPVTPYQHEILDILKEEACEVALAASKITRFGIENHPGKDKPNNHHLGHEIGELLHMVRILEDLGIVRAEDILAGQMKKRANLEKYLQTKP
jgi:NTP pyrophosphatase (non-canonical NTP hydrolase)